MGIDENHISLRPGGGIKGPVKTGNLPSFRSAPLQSSNRPLNSYRRPPIPLQSSHRPTVSLQTSHQRSEPLQSFSQALSRNSQSIIAESSIAGVDLQAQATPGVRNSEPIIAVQAIASIDLQTKATPGVRNSEPITARPLIVSVDLQTQSTPGVIRYSRDQLLQLERESVQRATFPSLVKIVPDFLRRDARQYSNPNESSRNENYNQISRPRTPPQWRTPSEWRSQRDYLPQAPTEKTDLTASRHSEPIKAGPVPGPSAIAKAAIPWSARRGNMTEKDKVLKTVKGILNKLTPEKFDSLKDQLLNSGITTVDILQGVISLVFDKAVMEPTFCFMYAELCVHLSSGLPEFPPEEPDGKPICFKRVLLNTSQTEFEGADNMRAQLKEMSGPKLLEKEQLLKRRTLGNIRFIAELFKQKMLPKPIVNVCIRELFGEDIKATPIAENVEALCQLFSLIGKQLEEVGESKQRGTSAFDSYITRLKKFGNDSRLDSRIRFMVRDVIELRANKWIPRREEVKAKTISEIHTEAERNLGLRPGTTRRQTHDAPRVVMQGTQKPVQNYVDPTDNKMMRPGDDVWRSKTFSNSMPGQNLRSLSKPHPTQPILSTSILPPVSNPRSAYRSPPLQATPSTSMAPPASKTNLLPQGKWSSRIFSKPPSFPSKTSALLLSNEKEEKPFLPPGGTSSLISSSSSSSEKQEKSKQIQDSSSAHTELKAEKLTADDLERKTQSLLKEYFHVRDLNEARQCVQDLDSPGYHEQLLFQAISMALEQKELHVQMVGELIDHLFSQKTVSKADIRDGFLLIAEKYDDFAIDVPLAPKYIGQLFGKSALNGTVDLRLLSDVLTKIEDIESRKKILDTALTTIKSDPTGKQLLSVQEAELSQCEKLTEE